VGGVLLCRRDGYGTRAMTRTEAIIRRVTEIRGHAPSLYDLEYAEQCLEKGWILFMSGNVNWCFPPWTHVADVRKVISACVAARRNAANPSQS
jgi:hypothetical protein